jgi:hypothetical protein
LILIDDSLHADEWVWVAKKILLEATTAQRRFLYRRLSSLRLAALPPHRAVSLRLTVTLEI